MKVLVIEDDSDAAAFVKGVLSEAGHFVDVCVCADDWSCVIDLISRGTRLSRLHQWIALIFL